MFLTIINGLVIAIVCLVVLVVLIALYLRKEGDREFVKYDSYTKEVLGGYEKLTLHEVKPEYKVLQPFKYPFFNLFKFIVNSEEGNKLKRVNAINASMLIFVRMYTFLIRPDYKYNLPILSVDIVFVGKKRTFIIEVIDPAKIEGENKEKYYNVMREKAKNVSALEERHTRDWYWNYIMDFSIHKKTDNKNDELLFDVYKSYLKAYLDMAKNADEVSPEQSEKHKAGFEEYVSNLLSKGGTAVEVFEKMLGKEGKEEYVRTVMFGLD